MSKVIGDYVPTFDEATHVAFEGNGNDPGFDAVAFQAITYRYDDNWEAAISTERYSHLLIWSPNPSNQGNRMEAVKVSHPLGRPGTTAFMTGYPFRESPWAMEMRMSRGVWRPPEGK